MLSEIEKRLDRRIEVSLKQGSEFFLSELAANEPFPCSVYNQEEKVFINVFIPKSQKNNPHFNVFLKKFKATERRDSYAITSRINNIKRFFPLLCG